MSGTTAATTGTTAATSTAAATTSATGAPATTTKFNAALANTISEARTIETTTLGSMVNSALKSTHVIAVSRPVVTSSAGATNSVAGASVSGSTKKGSVAVPDELRAYGNGKIPAEALSEIGIKRHKLWNVAADKFKEMRTAAANDGVDIGVTDSYRDYAEQVDLVRRKGLYSQGGLAAVPGTSPHGWGMALDLDVTPAGLSWLREHAAEYGYVEAVPREPWHWEFHGNK